MTKAEATELVEEVRDEILAGDSLVDAEDIILNMLGLEPDYLMDLFEIF